MKCGPRGVVAVVGVLALVAGSVLAQGFARLEVFPSNGCSGTPEVVDLTLDGCTEFAWTDPDAEINSLQLTQLMCGDTLSVVSVRGYAGAGCTDENTLFFSRTIFGGTIQPSECSEVATGSGLPVIKVASYVCDGDPTPAPISSPTPSPSPTAAPSPSPTPTPTPIESSTTTPSPTPSPSPSPTNSPDPVPTPTPVCIDAEWIEARGLEKVHASDGMGVAHSLHSLTQDFLALGIQFIVRQGDAIQEIKQILRDTGADAVFWNRLYEPDILMRDEELRTELSLSGVFAESFKAEVLVEPWEFSRPDGVKHFQDFSSYMDAWMALPPPPQPLPVASSLQRYKGFIQSVQLNKLLPDLHEQAVQCLQAAWVPGERGARVALQYFLEHLFPLHADPRFRKDLERSSRLSPYLRFGEISPRRLYHAVRMAVSVREPA